MAWRRIGRSFGSPALQIGINKEEGPEGPSSFDVDQPGLEALAASATAEDESRERDEQRNDATHLLPLYMASLRAFPGRWASKRSGSV